ncbi:flagellin N-terminal helical domain-containing protein [Porcipelethomonas sp.]|uniref:flagellin N-terminal helical domain-containing protein n=1 Tax=Porcipelethomonas sp. TaxID=2981675 RepID=UPI003EF4E9F2
MGMVVRTNINAINANRNLGKNNKTNSKSLEKLASGYRINRAGDDASGLAISEKMKAQIKALGTASDNCEDGISLVQTAEGYMTEIHDMLNRMVELAEKSANGINEDSGKTGASAYGTDASGGLNAGTDRAALQAEMDQLCAEIDRIALTANFNGNKLFNGNLDASSGASVANDDGNGFNASATAKALALQIGETSNRGDKLTVSIKRMTTDNLFKSLSTQVAYNKADGSGMVTSSLTVTNGTTGANTINVGVADVSQGVASSWSQGITINISDQAIASKSAELIRDAIDDVSLQRAQLGATQNRLDYTINNLDTAKENIENANSRIRDTDMAEEMMKYTQSNVLTQAAQAMLAQANTQPQNVLQLLQ